MNTSTQSCFHCGEAVTHDVSSRVDVDGVSRAVCCPGCQAAVELIVGSGWKDFYRFRTAAPDRPPVGDDDPWNAYDREALTSRFLAVDGQGIAETTLIIEGIRCAACAWLIDKALSSLPGIHEVRVNGATNRAYLRWSQNALPFSVILRRIATLGYQPVVIGPHDPGSANTRERNQALKRLAVAGLGMMQVLTYAVAMYAGAFSGMDPDIREFLRLVSLLVATPVAFYSGWPFFAGAWREIRAGAPGMDIPVALAIGGAYLASVWNTLMGHGEVYYDSVTMFVFFLSAGRFFEMVARHRSDNTSVALARLMPGTAVRLSAVGEEERIGRIELEPGDTVAVRPGDTVPGDGVVAAGESAVDESLLTGEPMAVHKTTGDPVIAGSINIKGPIQVAIERVGADSTVSAVARLVERAQSSRPQIARLADLVARRFVSAVLLLAAGLGLYLWQTAPEEVLVRILAVLVVTCPCALSLATPTALTAATSFLARRGLLVVAPHALETMARVTDLTFDKTGTLTRGQMSVVETRPATGHDRIEVGQIAAALERHSAHPLAAAFHRIDTTKVATEVEEVPGFGIEGRIDDRRYRIGRPEFAAGLGDREVESRSSGTVSQSWVALGEERGVVALFQLADEVRPGTVEVIEELRALGLRVAIVSGDAETAVAALARNIGVETYRARLLPSEKLELIQRIQTAGGTVAAVGDGINDAPVLGGADLSIAMASGSTLAQSSADMLLLGERLLPLVTAVHTARKTMRIIRQNFVWALLYNALALPIAAAGWIDPWMAAVGMSVSSLVVVLNAARLSGGKRPRDSDTRTALVRPATAEARS